METKTLWESEILLFENTRSKKIKGIHFQKKTELGKCFINYNINEKETNYEIISMGMLDYSFNKSTTIFLNGEDSGNPLQSSLKLNEVDNFISNFEKELEDFPNLYIVKSAHKKIYRKSICNQLDELRIPLRISILLENPDIIKKGNYELIKKLYKRNYSTTSIH